MTTTTASHDRSRPRTMLFDLRRHHVLAPNLAAEISEEVAERNAAATEAIDKFETAKARARDLGTEAKNAAAFDRLQREAAIARGDLPPTPTEATAQAGATEASKVADAFEQVAKVRVRAL